MASVTSAIENLFHSIFQILAGVGNSFFAVGQSIFALITNLVSAVVNIVLAFKDVVSGLIGFTLGT